MSGTSPPSLSMEDHVAQIHETLRQELPGIHRIAVATYDRKTDTLHTFVSSSHGDNVLSNYQKKLSEVPSLALLAESGRDRVIDDLSSLAESDTEHSRAIAPNFGSSYTKPLVDGQRLRGFAFFDAASTHYFTPPVVARLAIYAELIAVIVTRSLVPGKILRSAVDVASELSHSRDPETGAHLDRMSRFTLALGRQLADRYELSDETLQHLLTLSPLHDVGKIAIPDKILLKPGPLSDDEMAIMHTHTVRGAGMIDRLVHRLGLSALPQTRTLRNIVLYHHECWDGSGYPDSLVGERIPVEARLVTVADVYDALTSERPYKRAWSPDEALQYLEVHGGSKFDPDIVAAFTLAFDEIEEIRATFVDAPGALLFHEGYEPAL